MSNLDLNLMVIFDAIMQEQSITAAAKRLAMTQASVSNAVSRMRQAWKDPIFVKQGRGIRPTPFADRLWESVGEPLNAIRVATELEVDITDIKRTFRIAATDWMAGIFWLPLRKLIETEAPHVNIHAVPYAVNGEQLLLNADVDMVLDYYEGNSDKINSQWLFDNHYVCAMRNNHPLARGLVNIQQFTEAEHLLFSLSGAATGQVDTLLKQQGLSRRIAMTVNHCHNIPNILRNTDLITTIPLPIILEHVKAGDLVISDLPFEMTSAPISMSWHRRLEKDVALKWLRKKVEEVISSELLSQLTINIGVE